MAKDSPITSMSPPAHSSRPSPMASDWDSRSAAASSKPMEEDCSLPISQTAGRASPSCFPSTNPTAPAPLSLPTVFVVDDDRDFRESLVALLSALGHRVEAFDCAQAFRDAFIGGRPGCVLLDIRMPGESGIEMYSDMVRRGRRLPVVFVS